MSAVDEDAMARYDLRAGADLVRLTALMAEQDYEPSEIAYAVEKPWKFTDVLVKADAPAVTEVPA